MAALHTRRSTLAAGHVVSTFEYFVNKARAGLQHHGACTGLGTPVVTLTRARRRRRVRGCRMRQSAVHVLGMLHLLNAYMAAWSDGVSRPDPVLIALLCFIIQHLIRLDAFSAVSCCEWLLHSPSPTQPAAVWHGQSAVARTTSWFGPVQSVAL